MKPINYVISKIGECCISPALGVFYSEGISGG